MMIDNEPILAPFDVTEAVPRRQGLGLPVLDVGKRVVASIDGGVAINADELVAEGTFSPGNALNAATK